MILIKLEWSFGLNDELFIHGINRFSAYLLIERSFNLFSVNFAPFFDKTNIFGLL